MVKAKEEIIAKLKDVLAAMDFEIEPQVDHPGDYSHGDYSSNVALVAAKDLKQNPMELAEKIKEQLEVRGHPSTSFDETQDKSLRARSLEIVDRIEVAPPGFINFWLSKQYLINSIKETVRASEKQVLSKRYDGQKIVVEFAHPNTHKEFHIGHVRNIALGEAICRLLEANGAKVRRVNYQGDVGLHVAKAIFGVRKLQSKKDSLDKAPSGKRATFLGEAYALGSRAYEEDEKAREEIAEINKQIYTYDLHVLPLWKETRQWSLDYFDSIYRRLGTKFDRLYFESEVYEPGKEIVLAHIADGIFTKDQGAIIFDGEKYGLHKRVFITKDGNATYEAKEMGLGPLQFKEFPFDLALHIVGPEQAGYFAVTFKALELINPRFTGKEKHVSYGLVQLKEGKMSSRMGNVISGEWLLNETKRLLREAFSKMSDEILEQVTVGAVKYSMLKVGLSQNIKFSFEDSISLEGNSGPYLQYTFARTKSVLAKSAKERAYWQFLEDKMDIAIEEEQLLRTLYRFSEVVEEAAINFVPNLLCNYLFVLAQAFNLFYQKHKIIGSQSEEFRLSLTHAVGIVLACGLGLLGIAAPKQM